MYFYLRDSKSENETNIFLAYYVKSEAKKFKYPTGQKINPDDWNFENRMPKIKRGAKGIKLNHITAILEQHKNLLQRAVNECEISKTLITKDVLKTYFDEEFKNLKIQKQTTNIIEDVIDIFIERKNKSGGMSVSWNHKYANLRNKIAFFGFYNKNKVTFNQLNDDWLSEYCGFLRKFPNIYKDNNVFRKKVDDYCANRKIRIPKEGYNDNTLNRHVNFLITFLKWSENKFHKINLEEFKNFVDEFEPDKVYLTWKEVEMLENLIPSRPSLLRVRDLFLIGVYSGQRYSDYSVFEKPDVKNDLIIKKAEKTEDYSIIPLHDKLKTLLDKYNWSLPTISEQKFNIHIQEVCREAKILEEFKKIDYRGNKKIVTYHQKCDEVRSHTARATFITLSSESGMPDHIIMKITGIKDPKTLNRYKKTSQRSAKEWMNKIW